MNIKRSIRKKIELLFSAGATISVGFLSFAGMYVINPALLLCGSSFALAAVYEGQVNTKNISRALKRIFENNFLELAIARQYLEEQLETYELSGIPIDNIFLSEYKKRSAHYKKLKQAHHHSPEQKIAKEEAKKRLQRMEQNFVNQLRDTSNIIDCEPISEALFALLTTTKDLLNAQLLWKKRATKIGSFFALGGGISCGLATLSATQAGFAALGLLSAIPVSVIVGLSVFAAVGYALILYQSISKMIQEYNGNLLGSWKNYFRRRVTRSETNTEPDKLESKTRYILRCIFTPISVGLAIFATVATAGTWWYAAKDGAALLNLGNRAACYIRTTCIALMALPTLIFETRNSVEAVDDIIASDWKKLGQTIWQGLTTTWHEERNLLRFLNPIRLLEKAIDYSAKTLLFTGHLISMGVASDRWEAVSPTVSASINTVVEGLVDLNYLPNKEHGHSHSSKLLDALFFPVTVTVTALRCISVLWDIPFSGSATASWLKMFPVSNKESEHVHEHHHEHTHHHSCADTHDHHDHEATEPIIAESLVLSPVQKKQELIDDCNDIIGRLAGKSTEKVKAAQDIKQLVVNNNIEQLRANREARATMTLPFTKNRATFWHVSTPESKQAIDEALASYFGESRKQTV